MKRHVNFCKNRTYIENRKPFRRSGSTGFRTMDFVKKEKCKMKKLISTLAALALGCMIAVSAMAAGAAETSMNMQVDMNHVYISDAVIEVGETYTWHYDGEAGPVDYGEEGTALKIVSGKTNDEGGMTFVYEGIAPGTHTFRIVNRWWTETYKTVTVTVVAAGSESTETPSGDPAGQTQSASQGEHSDIAEAIANGTWGEEYTTCPACGYHNWTAGSEGYVCDTCGHIVSTVKTGAGVKGYVAPAASAPLADQRMTPAEAQAANDAYLAAISALQMQVAQREAAYLDALMR